ncbi:hypothetical protein BKA69DRAFT_1044007 [Paraphysoderma sedebokerense]|nr:hypothetical protein BKA69DRAFT_1044007 [Paraphysoderma sedebokerense]
MKGIREERLLRLNIERWRIKAEESENRELRSVILRRIFHTWKGITKMRRLQRLMFANRCIEIWKSKLHHVLDNESKAVNLSNLKTKNRYFYLWHQKISTRRKSNLIKQKLQLELNSDNQRRALLLQFGWKKWRKGTKVRRFDTKRKLIYAQSYYLKTLKRRVLLSWFNGTHKTFSSTILGSSLDQR